MRKGYLKELINMRERFIAQFSQKEWYEWLMEQIELKYLYKCTNCNGTFIGHCPDCGEEIAG